MKIIFPWNWEEPNVFTNAGIDLILFTGLALDDLNDPNTKPALLYQPYRTSEQAPCAMFYIEYDDKIFEMLTNFNPRQMITNYHTRLMELERIVPTDAEDAHLLKLVKETPEIRRRLQSLSQQMIGTV